MIYRYPKEYYKQNNRRYYLKHKKEILAKTKKYHEDHPEIARKNHKDNNRKYYEKNREKVLIKTREWQKNNPDKFRIISKRGMQKYRNTAKGIYRDIKQNSRIKARGEMLSQEEFILWYENQEKICFYCDINQFECKLQTNMRLTIDRMDNNKGYIKDNLVLACFNCNAVKKDILTVEEMKLIGQLVMKKRWSR